MSYGLSVFIQNGIFAMLYIAISELNYKWPDSEHTAYDKMYISMFVFIFGAFTAANA